MDSSIRLAQRDLCAVRWSPAILDEAQRALIDNRGDETRIRRRFQAMREHFADWEVTGYEALIPNLACEPGDRHVLAAAIRGHTSQIVTSNLRHFPPEALLPFGIEAITPDDFLLNVLDMRPKETAEVILEQAAALRRPSLTIDNLLATLAKCDVVTFDPTLARRADSVPSVTGIPTAAIHKAAVTGPSSRGCAQR